MFTTFLCLFLILLALNCFILLFINDVQPKPYMDEIFHVPQAQQYCKSNYSSWDPMITTLPGLYLVSIVLLKPVAIVSGLEAEEICSTLGLRAVNIFFTAGNVQLLYALLRKLHPDYKDFYPGRLACMAVILCSFPVLYFFTFLYYTDPGSTFFVLLTYLLSLHGNHMKAAMTGVAAILFRQTNIVWVVFVAGQIVGKVLLKWIQLEKKEINISQRSNDDVLKLVINLLYRTLRYNPKSLTVLMRTILVQVWSYILVGLGFVTFVYINNGIVVGARDQHQACLHFPQIFYFLSVTLFFASNYMISPKKIYGFCMYLLRNPLKVALFLAVAFIFVSRFTHVHEYLLSDNRHYPFYVWSKLFRRHDLVKFILIPVYLYALWSFMASLHNKDIFFKIVFSISLILTTVPQKLLEFRYFILPYLIFRLNMKPSSVIGLALEAVLYSAVNVMTIYMFVARPFQWDNSDQLQRFMW